MKDITANFVVDKTKNVLYAVPMKGYLTVLDLQNLQEKWKVPMGAYITPLLYRDSLVITDRRNYIYRLRATDGSTNWRVDSFKDRNLTSTVIVEGKYLVFGDGYGYIHILDLLDGSYLGKEKMSLYGFVQNAIYYDSSTERVYAMDKYGMLFSIYIEEYTNRRVKNNDRVVDEELEAEKDKILKDIQKEKEEYLKNEKSGKNTDVKEEVK